MPKPVGTLYYPTMGTVLLPASFPCCCDYHFSFPSDPTSDFGFTQSFHGTLVPVSKKRLIMDEDEAWQLAAKQAGYKTVAEFNAAGEIRKAIEKRVSDAIAQNGDKVLVVYCCMRKGEDRKPIDNLDDIAVEGGPFRIVGKHFVTDDYISEKLYMTQHMWSLLLKQTRASQSLEMRVIHSLKPSKLREQPSNSILGAN